MTNNPATLPENPLSAEAHGEGDQQEQHEATTAHAATLRADAGSAYSRDNRPHPRWTTTQNFVES